MELHCITSPLHTVGCQDFWFNALIAFVSICFIGIVLLIISILKERSTIKAYHQRMLARAKVADPDQMDKHKWKGDV